ncbi:MAG: toprim domain-containing protein [Thalassolituus sp.]
MKAPPKEYQQLVEAFDGLPGIGLHAAQRLTEWLVYHGELARFSDALVAIQAMTLCSGCNRIAGNSVCDSCAESDRSNVPAGADVFLVIDTEESLSVIRDAGIRNRHFVLHGQLSPAGGVGPAQLHVDNLLSRLAKTCPAELILITGASVEGRATADYILRRSGVAGKHLSLEQAMEELESSVE